MADNDSTEPVLRDTHAIDKVAPKLADKAGSMQDKAHRASSSGDNSEKSKQPAGGFDATPVPKAPPGYTLRITFHRADNLPFADFGSFSSDPYILATLKTGLAKRHKQDPDLVLRTPTIHKSTNPKWETQWVVKHVPASGFFLKCRLYDEDPADHDDRLGNAHIRVESISDKWEGFKERKYDIKKRMGSKRAYTFRACAAFLSKSVKFGGDLVVSIENLGKSEGDGGNGGRAYTVGPLPWCRHYSPLIGRLAGTKFKQEDDKGGKSVEKYNFQAIQMQLQGPVPEELYHRYVEFKPFVAGMFTAHTLRGRILNRALHHQHARIYNYDRSTLYGIYQEPCIEMTKRFLDFVHYDQGGRIFTYVLTLDGLWRFTETGKEFGIDMLSKHTMHSNVNIYIAFSGEFFIRRLKHPHKDKNDSPDPATEALPPAMESDTEESGSKDDSQFKEKPKGGSRHAPSERSHEITSAEGQRNPKDESSKDPSQFELIIDNDSGTYRPNAKYLSSLKHFLKHNLPGLRVVTLDCQGDEEKMKKLKKEQRDKKEKSGKQITYMQNSSDSSLSSSDEEELEERANGGGKAKHGFQSGMSQMKNAASGVVHHGRDGADSNLGGRVAENDKDVYKEEGEKLRIRQ